MKSPSETEPTGFVLWFWRLVGVTLLVDLLWRGHWVIALLLAFLWWTDACRRYGV